MLLLNDLWEELKIESPVSVAIIVIAGAVLTLCLGAGVFFGVRKYRRRRLLEGLWD